MASFFSAGCAFNAPSAQKNGRVGMDFPLSGTVVPKVVPIVPVSESISTNIRSYFILFSKMCV
jgi:hypothetical protein